MATLRREKGFVLMLLVAVIFVIAATWFIGKQKSLISVFKTNDINADFIELELVKERLLEYAALHPEVYTKQSGDYQPASEIPAPGYLPCPDLDGNGLLEGAETSCSNPLDTGDIAYTGFVPDGGLFGYVPERIDSHHIYFAESGRYFYFVDERFVAQNNGVCCINNGRQRYAPMNGNIRFEGEVESASSNLDSFEPVLTLNGKRGYIAIIIDAGEDGIDDVNGIVSGVGKVDRHFISRVDRLSDDPNADKIVGLSYEEWNNAINRRMCIERFRYEGLEFADEDGDGSPDEVNPFSPIASDIKHWYNTYIFSNDGDATNDNAGGASWRDTNLKCKYDY